MIIETSILFFLILSVIVSISAKVEAHGYMKIQNIPCGNGEVGIGKCAGSNECCSEWGWCGTSLSHCKGVHNDESSTNINIKNNNSDEFNNNDDFDEIYQAPPSQVAFPPWANGSCENPDEVMSVNIGYYQSWAIWRDDNCNKIMPDEINVADNGYTHLIYSFASINTACELEPWDSDYSGEEPLYEKFNSLKQKNPNLKTLIAVGGWTFNDPEEITQFRFSDTADTHDCRTKFANSVVEFCRKYDFDGIDLDWEYPGARTRGGRPEIDKANYALLVEAVRTAFDKAPEDFVLSMAVPSSLDLLETGFDLSALASGLDFFNIMAYDFNGGWNSVTGAHSDINTIFYALPYFLKFVPSHKLVLGLAAYGRTYKLSDPKKCNSYKCHFTSGGPGGCAGSPNFMPYFTIQEYIQSGNYNSYVPNNPQTGSAELVIDDNIWIDFDSKETFEQKALFAQKACLGGYMWWAVDMFEQPLILNILKEEEEDPLFMAPPQSSPTQKPTKKVFDKAFYIYETTEGDLDNWLS